MHVVLVDLFPPGKHDPRGMHGEVWERLDDEPYEMSGSETLTLASYVADTMPQAYVEHLAVGDSLVEMPLFLDSDRYINLPLEGTYQAAWRGMPVFGEMCWNENRFSVPSLTHAPDSLKWSIIPSSPRWSIMSRVLHDGRDDGLEPLESLDLAQMRGFADLLRRMAKTAFGGRELGEAFHVLRAMTDDPDCTRVLTIGR